MAAPSSTPPPESSPLVVPQSIIDNLQLHTAPYRQRIQRFQQRLALSRTKLKGRGAQGLATLDTDTSERFTSLRIFDFDNTLYKSPVPSPWLWDTKLIGKLLSTDIGWYHDPRTLSPPYVVPRMGDYNPLVLAEARRSLADPQCLTVLLTGRNDKKFRTSLNAILRKARLHFDIVFLKDVPSIFTHENRPSWDESPASPIAIVPTFSYKTLVIDLLLDAFPSVKDLHIWEDRTHHRQRFRSYAQRLVQSGRLVSSTVPRFKPAIGYMPMHLETQLVHALVGDYNARQQALVVSNSTTSVPNPLSPDHVLVPGPLSDLSELRSPSLGTVFGGSGVLSPTEVTLSPQPSLSSATPPHLVLQSYVDRTELKFSNQSFHTLLSALPLSIEHLYTQVPLALLCKGALTETLQKYLNTCTVPNVKTRYNLDVTVDSVAQVDSQAVLARIRWPEHLNEFCFGKRAPFLVVACRGSVAGFQNSIHSITEWSFLESPIHLRACLIERTLSTVVDVNHPEVPSGVTKELELPLEERPIKLSSLIQEYHPHVQGKAFGKALDTVKVTLAERGVVNIKRNEEILRTLVQECVFPSP
ncbi:hypothetical protein IWQ62_000450 [Dispira parvispora]|uniref:Swiss Army Knife RNA repair protein HAD domain-containing protein n=1 Tax=Dispira parvispora TaxID=1520584 RepID=A0A9W8AYC3_9FUNG|nr:hypothetical protein IWQ62_000450 [Dispira parvispora]